MDGYIVNKNIFIIKKWNLYNPTKHQTISNML